jgi:hypothetical protein
MWVEEKHETMVFVTNILKLAASTIVTVYKTPGDIEWFFKRLEA